MKIRIPSLVTFLLIFSFHLFSQSTFSTRIGISTINEIQIEVINAIDKNRFVYSNIGYIFNNLEGPGCGTLFIMNTSFDGFNMKIGITEKKEKVKKNKTYIRNNTFSIFYRRLNGNRREGESICGGFDTTNFEYTYNDIGLSFIRDRDLNKRLTFYWSISAAKRFQIKSTTNVMTNSQENKNSDRDIIMFDIGFRLKLFQIKAK